MNTRKDRYAVRISGILYIEMQEQALRDGAKQGHSSGTCGIGKGIGAGERFVWNVYGVGRAASAADLPGMM